MFYQKRKNLPTINQIGRLLEDKRLVRFKEKIYAQTDRNCFEIASELAGLFGYQPLKSQRELIDAIFNMRLIRKQGDSSYLRFYHNSPVCFIVRTGENARNIHVAFEGYGREYNYGPCSKDGFPIEMRIPLSKQLFR